MPSVSKQRKTKKIWPTFQVKSAKMGLGLLCLVALNMNPVFAQDSLVSKQAQQHSQQLSKAFNQQPSFQADYFAVSAKGQAKIRLIMNQEKRFALVSVTMDAETEPAYWAVLDYAIRPQQIGLIKMFAIVPEAGLLQADLNFKAVFASLDHPVGIFRFLNQQALLVNGQKTKPDAEDWLPKTPILELGLTDEHLLINLSVSSMDTERFASWLAPEKLKQALKIDATAQSVSFTLPAAHQLVIDSRTGMLLKESWNKNDEAREIRQQAFGALQDQRSYQDLIPNFASLPVNPMPIEPLYQQFANQLLSEQASDFLPQAPMKLATLKPAQQNALRQAARLAIRAQVRRGLQPEAVQVYQTEVLQPAYQRYLQTHSTQAADLSFLDYLSRYLASAEADPEHVQMPGLRQQAAQLAELKNQSLAKLKPEQSIEMERLWNWGWPSIEQAWALELLSASIESLQAQQ